MRESPLLVGFGARFSVDGNPRYSSASSNAHKFQQKFLELDPLMSEPTSDLDTKTNTADLIERYNYLREAPCLITAPGFGGRFSVEANTTFSNASSTTQQTHLKTDPSISNTTSEPDTKNITMDLRGSYIRVAVAQG